MSEDEYPVMEWMPSVIICEEKHSTNYWDATSPEAAAKSALAILTERWNQGWWYNDPSEDGLGTSEWADKVRADNKRAMEMTKEQYDALPEVAQKHVLALRKRIKQERAYAQEYQVWYDAAKKVVTEKDSSVIVIGKGRYKRYSSPAFELLYQRSDHEYESVSLETLLQG